LAGRDALEGTGPFGAAEIDGFWVMSSFRLLAKTGFVLFLVLPLTIGSSGASASDHQGGGDQGGSRSWRTALEDRGIAFSVESDTDVFVNARGGINQRAVAFNWLKLGLNLNVSLTGLAPFQDANIHAEAHYPAGTDVSSYVGDLAGVNNNAAYNSFRLYELWVEKGFKVGPFVGLLKAGLLSADQEKARRRRVNRYTAYCG
jgi:carbohydrate-selective porin OprB